AGASGTFTAGSGNGSGSAALVSASVSGSDITTGANAVALYEQSAAGSDNAGGRVTANVSGTLSSLLASAIYQTSTGGQGGGALNVTVTPTGEVETGASAPSNAAVNFAAGANATLFNNGIVAAPNGYAVMSNALTTSITNNGTMIGSVQLASGANTFTNTGTFEAGPVVNLGGASNSLINNGTLAIGFLNAGGTTTITGNLTQTPNGTLLEAVNLGAPDPPELVVTGNASLQGTLAIASIGMGNAMPGDHTFTLIGTGGTLSDSMTLSTAPSAVVHYTLDPVQGNTVTIESNVNFDPSGLTSEGGEFGAYVNAVQLDGPASSLRGMVAQAVSAPNASALERLYDEVTPESFGAMEAATLTNALGFSQQMNECRSITDASYISSTRDRCTWGTIGNTSTTQFGSGDVLGYNESATGVNIGTESAISGDKRTFFGAGFNFSYDNVNVNSTTMNGSRYMGGLSLKREADNGFVYTAELTGGVASYQTNRWIIFPSQTISDADGASGYGTISTPDVQATSTGHVSFLGAGVRTQKQLQLRGGWTLTPYLSLNDTQLYMSPLSETGAGGLSITTQAVTNGYVTLQPGVQFSGAIGTIASEHLHLHVDLFATQFLGNTQTSLSAMLQGEPAGLGMTQFNSSIDRTLWNVAPTLDVTGKHGLDFRLGGSYLFSSHLHSGTVNVNVSQKIGRPPGEI
ncbi:MAG: autotransporter domain-containing protein, partial [Candidatus Aquilonibacter sp.]